MNNFKIYCKRVKYYETVEYSEVNFFNRTGIDTYTNKVELADILEISNIKYDQSIILSGDTLQLIKKCNDVNITLGTISNNQAEFFKVKDNAKKYLYVFFIKYNNDLIFTSVSTQDNIEYAESPSPDTNQITITIKTLLNHFLDYFNNKTTELAEMEEVFSYIPIGGSEYKSANLTTFFHKFFFNNDLYITVTNDTGFNWLINRQPFFICPSSTYSFVTNGFRKMYFESSITKTDFFLKLCNSMGWDFSLKMDFNEIIVLSFKNRSRTILGTTLTLENIHSIKYTTQFDLSNVDYIVIKDGLIKGGYGYLTPQGIPVKIISQDETYSNRGYFFGRAVNDEDDDCYILYPREYPNYYMIGNVNSAVDILDFEKVRFTDFNTWASRTTEVFKIANRNILYIDTGENSKGSLVDMATRTMTIDADDLGESKNDVYYRGCYGSMLMIQKPDGTYSNYDDYSTTPQFVDNFRILLKNKNSDSIEIKYNGLLTDYYNSDYSKFTFMTGNEYLDRSWDIIEVELNTKEKTTKLILKLSI